ncbi:hypothetical protein DPMN_038063 [Dreissena polymorpha]|uniref:Uncharacterized protein n=1 Tax=Dreissena polymorpha TaxID=45954 RepID=A0A9D4MEQ7_DREPO|nr:hypothetical protein DPMN_038063 [Dreissena polymorpha]
MRHFPCTLTYRQFWPGLLIRGARILRHFSRPLSNKQDLSPGSDRVHADLPSTALLTRKNAPPPFGHFHEDWTIKCLQDFTIAIYGKMPSPPGGHVFQPTGTIFELIKDIISTNLLTKKNEHWTINVASRVLTRHMLTPHDVQRTTDDGQKAITIANHKHIMRR